MTQKEFDEAITRLLRRAELLRGARDGSVKLKAVHVGKTEVRAHWRRAHTRYIAPTGWKPRRSS